jgi:hypothetical protein
LEFLGDRVLGLVVAEMLFAAYPDAPAGELSVRLNALVNAETWPKSPTRSACRRLIRRRRHLASGRSGPQAQRICAPMRSRR